jgi:hypothetical protein
MDRTGKFKQLIFTAIVMVMVMPSCVRNDMDECPATAVYSLIYEYTLNPDEVDRFTELDRLYIYVFEKKTGECIAMDTENGPFPSDYRYFLSLFPGEYDIITWGYDWPDNDPSRKMTTVIPDIKVGIWGVPGTGTKISDARLILEELKTNGKDGLPNVVNSRMENTFYGESHAVCESVYDSKTDTVSLINLTNQVRIIFEDVTTTRFQSNVSVKITDKNGAYYFYKSMSDNPAYDESYDRIEYLPCAMYKTDSILNKDPVTTHNFAGTGLDSVLVADFSVLRLFKKNEDPFVRDYPDVYLTIEWTNEDGTRYGNGGDQPALVFSLSELLGAGVQRMGFVNSQEALDKINRWEIMLNLQETYVTGTVNVLGWEVQGNNVTGGLF